MNTWLATPGSDRVETKGNWSMNVLILTAGSRVQTLTCFKRALASRGCVIATDASELAPALYAADGHHVVPLITDPE